MALAFLPHSHAPFDGTRLAHWCHRHSVRLTLASATAFSAAIVAELIRVL